MIEDSDQIASGRCPSKADVVCIHYDDLVAACRGTPSQSAADIASLIEGAFSSIGLGIIAITDVPDLPERRLRLLRLSQKLAALPTEHLDEITVPESSYQVGWSHGREKLEGDKLDYSKGSFYANPLTEDLAETMLERRRYRSSRIPSDERDNGVDPDVEELLEWDESLKKVRTDDELRALARSNPAFFAPNVWPSKHLPDMESSFREVGQLIHEVGTMVARCCDSYVSSRCPGYEPKLEKILRHSKCCKARLLHYFPPEDDRVDDATAADAQFSDWCGWHNDHGSLTGLLPALYLDGDGDVVDPPDPEAGLYIKSRDGRLVRSMIPEGAVAFQVGETAQIHTGGLLKATPHSVRGCRGPEGRVSREAFAVFMEPEFHSAMDLPIGRTLEDTQCVEDERRLPSSVRTLRSRWKLGMTFGEFSDATFSAFH